MALSYHALGQETPSDAALTALITKYAKDDPYVVASVYAYRGKADSAVAWLDKSVQVSDASLSNGVQSDPLFAKLHTDPRWLPLPLLREAGYAPEQLTKIAFTATLPVAACADNSTPFPVVETSATAATPAQASTASTDQNLEPRGWCLR